MNIHNPFVSVYRSLVVLLAGMTMGLFSQAIQASETADAPATPRQRQLLDSGWRFHLGDISPDTRVIGESYDDQTWRHVDLPNDYVLDGTYTQTATRTQGYLPAKVGWYRRHLVIPASSRGKVLRLDFDGVFRDSQVWLNGQLLGRHLSGYTPFSYDITKIAHVGGDNEIAVRVDPSKFEGWWYEGGGIYRHVYLTTLSPVHIAQWGTYVVSTVPGGDQGADDLANLTIQTRIENAGGSEANCQVESEIIGPKGQTLQIVRGDETTPGEMTQHATVSHPKLWSPETPNLYQLRTTLLQGGKAVDSTTTTFGIRTIRFDVNQGFFLNGKHVEIYGCACHQDMPAVGIAVPDSLEPWRVAQLKKAGANGWRTAHNEPNEAVLDACDRLGMLVMDENRHLGGVYTPKTHHGDPIGDLSDLATMIQRDRNHPSVIMWSMCNEEDLQGTPEGARIFSAMKNMVDRYDDTRPVTSAMNGRGGKKIFMSHGLADVEDIIGVNYNYDSLDAIHQRHPDKPMFGSEDSNEKTTRGSYTNDRATGMCSAYNLSEKTWQALANRPFIAGGYVWTGFDYKGEPNPYGWPDVSNNTGIVDSCGFPKDKFFYFQSCWTTKPMVHILPSTWNWPANMKNPIRVLVFSNAPEVELFLNGQSLGEQPVPKNGNAEWQVPYQPGELIAKAYADGQMAATDELQTTGAPARIVLSPARSELHAAAEDAVVVAVSILDSKGRVVPDSANRVEFQVTDGAKILGVGNGDPADHDPDRADQRHAFHGHCIVILEAGNHSGHFRLTASSNGLAEATASFTIR